MSAKKSDNKKFKCSKKWHAYFSHAFEKTGNPQTAEDFAQWVQLKKCQGRETTIHHAWVDYTREKFGREKESKASTTRRAIYFSNSKELPKLTTSIDELEAKLGLSFYFDLSQLTDEEHKIIFLKAVWGLTNAEIGQCWRLTEGRICQIIKEMRKRLAGADSEFLDA